MSDYTALLWKANNEYRQRLSRAENYLDLLDQLVVSRDGDRAEEILAVVRQAREQLAALDEDHRHWRYRYYYESPESKRMVQTEEAVHRALANFSRMHARHEPALNDVYIVLYNLSRPEPDLTRVSSGDLWAMTEYALYELAVFGDYLNGLNSPA
jgi:hypothetical protein